MDQPKYVIEDGKIFIKDIDVLLRLYELWQQKRLAREVAARLSRDV